MAGKILAVDTEDNSQGQIYWINFYDGRKHYSFDTREKALKFLDSLSKCVIWAVNLEYDTANIFEDLSIIKLRFGKSRLISVNYKNCRFLDTLNHWKMSVEAMGAYLGKKKLPFNPKSLKYCQRDTEVTFDFVFLMLKKYGSISSLPPASTVSATSLKFWKEHSNFLIRKTKEETLEKIRPAYYGGRTECFYIGKVTGRINYIDINSMYPYCMLGDFPYPYKINKGIDLNSYGVTSAEVSSDLEIPVLPYRRKDGRLIFPNGRFKGVWVNNELARAVKEGVKIKRLFWGVTYPCVCEPFSGYILSLYKIRKKSKDELMRYTYKLLMNSLYGKFAQGNEVTKIEPIEKFEARKKLPERAVIYQDKLALFTEIGKYPQHTNYIWSAYITARARLKLYDLITLVIRAGGQVLYCDTDSVVFRGPVNIPISDELGGAKLEGTFSAFEVRSAKEYTLTSEAGKKFLKVKGVPKLHQECYFNRDYVEYKKPLRIKESIRRNLKPNIWIDHKKVKCLRYDKGIIGGNGEVKPLIINT